MKNFTALIVAVTTAVSHAAMAASYSTEATITPLPDNGQYRVDVRVSRMAQREGKVVEELIAKPRILSGVGCPASLYQGLQPANPDYQHEDNVSVDVSWPYPDESGVAFCTVVVKHGDELVSKSKLQLQITGKGRVPLVLSPQTVDPKSVRVEVDKSKSIAFVLLEFAHKPDKEARAMAIENLGNHVEIRDAAGHSAESGIISGTYKEMGVALQYDSEEKAQRVADILDGAPQQSAEDGDRVLTGRRMSENQVVDIAYRELPQGSHLRFEFKDGVWDVSEAQPGVWGLSSATTNADGKVFVSSTNATRVVLRVSDADGKVAKVKTP